MSEDTQDPNKYKRKRKKTFLRNARKYGKKGCYGRGSELDADTYQTLVRLMEVYKAGFPSHDDKGKHYHTILFIFTHGRSEMTTATFKTVTSTTARVH